MSDEKVIQKQKEWIEMVTNVAIPASAEAVELAKRKADGQKKIESVLGPERDMIKTVFESQTVVLKNKGIEGFFREMIGKNAEMRLMDPGHDPMKEFDTWHDNPNVESIDEQDLRELTDNYKKIVELGAELRKNPYYAEPPKPAVPPEPSTAEQRKEYREAMEGYEEKLKEAQRRLAEDLWNPLQREGVIPESWIPNDYSEVKRQFDEANAHYEERLKEYSKELGDYGSFMQHFDDAVAIGGGMLKVAASSAGVVGSVGELTKNADVIKNAEEAKKVITYVEVALSSTSGIVKGALTERDAVAVADGMNIGLSAAISGVVPKPWNDIVNGGIEAGIRGAAAGKKFANGDIEGGINEFAAGILGSLTAMDKSEDKRLVKIGQAIAAGVQGLAVSSTVVAKVKEGDYRGALSHIVQNIGSVVPPANSEALSWITSSEGTESGIEEDIKGISEQQKIIDSVVDKEALAALKEKAAKMQKEQFDEFMRQQDRAFEEALAYGFSDPLDEDMEAEQAEQKRVDSLKHIVAMHKRNEMMFELAKKLVTGGPALVADLVPGMGLVAAATQLAFAIGEAIKQAEQLLIWADNVSDAEKASTAQVDAMLNRYGLQKKQVIQANIKVAIQAVKVAGEATKLAGEAAPVGFVVSAAADLAESVMEVSAKVVEVAEMQRAWVKYKKALENPQDRKAAREAMRSNPTLAKYAMAWGAVEDNNPMAKEAMRRCGLNEKTLAQRETNVGAVVEYLEMIYKDDPVLLRAVPINDKWYPGDPEVSFRSWQKFLQAALTKAKPALKKLDVSGVSGSLGNYETAGEALIEAIKDAQEKNTKIALDNAKADREAREKFRSLYKEYEEKKKTDESLEAPAFTEVVPTPYVEPEPALYRAAVDAATAGMVAFGKLKPLTDKGEPHTSFKTYCSAMEAKLRIARDGLDKSWDAREWLPA